MTKKIDNRYTAAPRGLGESITKGPVVKASAVEALLRTHASPPLSDVLGAIHTRKTTLGLTDYSVEVFKQAAEKYRVPYQQLMREALHAHAKQIQHELQG